MSSPLSLPVRDRHLDRLGFERHPFPVIPDASQYHLTPRLDVLAREVLFAVQQRGGFIVLTGEVGLGKTTFCRYILGCLNDGRTSTSLVFNSYLQEDELIEQIILDFGLSLGEGSVRERIAALSAFFLSERAAGRNCVIFIDDAQNLSPRSLEYVRLLSNLETEREKLVQVLLVGQPELRATLDDQALRQLKSRITLEREFLPLDRKEARAYIDAKLSRATGEVPLTIGSRAAARVYRFTQGNPRAMNLLLDRVLLSLITRRRRHIAPADVTAAYRDIGQRKPQQAAPWLLALAIVAAGLAMIFVARQASAPGGESPYYAGWARVLSWLELAGAPAERDAIDATRPSTDPGANDETAAPAASPRRIEEAAHALPAAGAVLTAATLAYLNDSGLSDLANAVNAFARDGAMNGINQLPSLPGRRTLAAIPYRLAHLPAALPVVTQTVPGEKGWWVLVAWSAITPPGGLFGEAASERIASLQQRLRMLEFYTGAIDGIAGPLTRGAVADLQRTAGLPATTRLDNATRLAIDHPDLFGGLAAARPAVPPL